MPIDPKTQRDIEFTRSVLENLEEPERAARMARAMIERYSLRPDGQDAVNAYRRILLSAIIHDDDNEDAISEEYEKLFAGYLSVRDRASAANVLMDVANLWRRENIDLSFQAVNKCIELFRSSNTPEVAEIVDSAFEFRDGYDIGFFKEGDNQLITNRIDYANWLVAAPISVEKATDNIVTIFDLVKDKIWLPIASKFVATRSEELSRDDYYKIQIRIMWKYEEFGEFNAAIDIGFEILKRGFSEVEGRAETVLTLGTCFQAVGEFDTARMFLQAAKDLLATDPEHWVWKMATDALDEIEGALDDIDDA